MQDKCLFSTRVCPKIILNCFTKAYQQVIVSSYLHHCVKRVHIRSSSGPYFPAFGLEKL